MATLAENFTRLDRKIPEQADYQLAHDHAPLILFDTQEPFVPCAVAYSVFRQAGPSPSFPREIELAEGVVTAIEYAIWWDWDIQHLYELEHIWLYLDAEDHVVDAEASWHGGFNRMVDEHGALPLREGRLVLHSEAGKHAFAPSMAWLNKRKPTTISSCGSRCGTGGVLIKDGMYSFNHRIKPRNPYSNQLVHSYLETYRFEPSFRPEREFDLGGVTFVIWESLRQWIPQRMQWWIEEIERTLPTDQWRVLRIAHRGASAHAAENSREAFEKAAELGSDMVELDLRLSADDVPVVSHDEDLQRLFGIKARVADLSMQQLRAQTDIMSFAEVVELCRTLYLGLYLDIKAINRAGAEQVFAVLDEQHMTDYTIFSSFQPDVVAEIKALQPHAQTSILFHSTHIDPVQIAKALDADYVHPCWEHEPQPHGLLTADWLADVRAAGLGVICWHEERPAEIAALKALGVTGICSDQPELLV